MRRKNITAAIVIIVMAMIYGLITLQLPTRSLPDTPGPTFFPWINVVIILFLSVLLLLSSAFTKENGSQDTKRKDVTQNNQNLRGLWAIIGFSIYLIILPNFGFLISTIPFFAFLMILFSEKRPLYILSNSIGITFLFYFVFRHGFNIFLPQGVLHDVVLRLIL